MHKSTYFFLVILGIVFLPKANFAQFETLEEQKLTTIKWEVSNPVALLSQKYINENSKDSRIQGFRVQLFFGNRDEAQKVRTAFLKKHPNIEAEIDYLAPNFRVRVGGFRTHLEAYRFHQRLVSEFSGSYIVQDKIRVPPLSSKY